MVGRLDEWHPVTGTVAFFETDLDAIAAARAEQEQAWGRSGELLRVDGAFPETLRSLESLALAELIVPDHSWCAIFASSADLDAVVLTLNQRLRCRSVYARSLPNLYGRGKGDNVTLELYDPSATDDPDGLLRLITLSYDDSGWEFTSVGDPQPWEDLDAYKAKRKADRFPAPLLLRYLDAIGIPPLDGPGWGPGGVLVRAGTA